MSTKVLYTCNNLYRRGISSEYVTCNEDSNPSSVFTGKENKQSYFKEDIQQHSKEIFIVVALEAVLCTVYWRYLKH